MIVLTFTKEGRALTKLGQQIISNKWKDLRDKYSANDHKSHHNIPKRCVIPKELCVFGRRAYLSEMVPRDGSGSSDMPPL